MRALPPIVFSYNRVIIALVAVMLASLALIDYGIMRQQRQSIMAELDERATIELEQAATFMTEPLLRYRFSDVEVFIQQWSINNREVIRFAAYTPQDHLLTVFERPPASPHIMVREKRIEFGGRHLLTLVMEKDYGHMEQILAQLRNRLIQASLYISAALGVTLWFVFRFLAIRPLELEVLRRRQAEQELAEANQRLEERVRDRTREIADLLNQEKYLREIMQTVAEINGLLITAPNLETMLRKSCLRFVRHSHYEFCWIGLLEEGAIGSVYTSEAAGGVVLAPPPYSLADRQNPFYRHPAASSLRRDRTVICDQQEYPSSTPPWHDQQTIAGFRQMVALPLRAGAGGEKLVAAGTPPAPPARATDGAAPLGVLTVYSWRQEGFEAEEIAMLEELAADLGFAIAALRQREHVTRLNSERLANYEETIFTFVGMIEQRDTYTAGHTERVAYYCQQIAKEMGLAGEDIYRLYRAAILHDIGKIATPDAVLLKPGRLDELERDLIKLHAVAGYEMLSKIAMYQDLAKIILHHHERYDGNGYPDRLAGAEIPLLARILIVADSFDAMTTNRIYKPRLGIDGALERLRTGSGKQFDPEVVAAALKVLGRLTAPVVPATEPDSERFCVNHPALCGISQAPGSDLEQKRFSYFFSDHLTGLYNEEYLKATLHNNEENFTYQCIHLLHLHGLAAYNKQQGWEKGNQLLKDFAAELKVRFPDALLFRVYGNDFIVVSREHLPFEGRELTTFAGLEVISRHLDLVRGGKYTLDKLEKIVLSRDGPAEPS